MANQIRCSVFFVSLNSLKCFVARTCNLENVPCALRENVLSALGCIALHCLTVFVSYEGSLPTVPKIGNSYLTCQIGDSGGLGVVVPLIYRTSDISLVTDLANLLNNKQPSSLLLSYPFRLSFLKSILILPFRHSTLCLYLVLVPHSAGLNILGTIQCAGE